MIELNGVSKLYKTSVEQIEALSDVSLSIKANQFVGIIGPSGSGKTTLLQVMGLLEKPTEGDVWIGGVKINDLPDREKVRLRNEKISYVFQQYQLLPSLTAVENVMLPVLQFKKKKENIERADYLLEQVGLAHRRTHPPSKLSGGEQQRLAIARALMSNPEIILADELTGNLDEETTEHVMNFLQEVHKNENKTIVIVTHNLELIDYTNDVYRLRNGQLYEAEEYRRIANDPLPK